MENSQINIEVLPQIVVQTLNSPDLSKLKFVDSGDWLGVAKVASNLIPCVGGAVAELTQKVNDYRLNTFFRKLGRYIYDLIEVPEEKRHKFTEEIQAKAQDDAGHVLIDMVDRLDNINKAKYLAQLSIARINGNIGMEDFFRLSSMLERISFVDLEELPRYQEPYYDKGGDSELLYATGALELHTLDANDSNKYVLSQLGEKLVRWGLDKAVDVKRSTGTNMELNTIGTDEIHDLMHTAF